ncbi:MAG: transglutaminase family protein [Methylacidiphilaceae bacterium]|nr:transglutaminase family protein [Candidatus Methylacidiphilaceae bacterium]
MKFSIVHSTEYEYSQPALHSYSELRIRPRSSARQDVLFHRTDVEPGMPLHGFTDCYGNLVEFFSIPFRHSRLVVTAHSQVRTRKEPDPPADSAITIEGARGSFAAARAQLFDFLAPSRFVSFSREIHEMAAELLPPDAPFGESIFSVGRRVHELLRYVPGSTDAGTPVLTALARRQGVCQDFAHLALALLRSGGIPARYVSGYIEPIPPRDWRDNPEAAARSAAMAVASHAWVEIRCPDGSWVGLDPTNLSWETEQHVQAAVGRDYADVAPLRGICTGARDQRLSVSVRIERIEDEASTANDALPGQPD